MGAAGLNRSLPSDHANLADANFVSHAGWVQRQLPGMQVLDRPDLVLIDSGLPCDTFNFVCRARLDRSDAPERVREAVAYFRERRLPFSWWVGPADQPGDLGGLLVAAGLDPAETELAMVADLSELGSTGATVEGLRIERVDTERKLEAFAQLSAANWTPPDSMVLQFYELGKVPLLSEDCPLRLYVGYCGDVPVGTAEATVGGGVVGLYNISTLAAYRRRGFGAALTLRALLDAREEGARSAVLQAAPDGVGLYTRLGFRPFGDITEYKPAVSTEA
ncbi:MAG: GNAT family N-acetyltransferase [Gemmatimonadota bacterium]